MAYELGKLPYAYDALQPFMEGSVLELHHGKHHNTYVTKLNDALKDHPEIAAKDIKDVLTNIKDVPESIRQAVINHGGGHANHTLFWETMGPGKNGAPVGAVKDAIDSTFKSFDEFKSTFNNAGITQFGSGWAWLVVDNADKSLKVTKSSNQDSPLSIGQTPILTCDVWEHAYYLQFQNRRPEFIESWWNIVNWEMVNDLYVEATK